MLFALKKSRPTGRRAPVGDKDPERLNKLLTVYLGLKAELDAHMAKEEQILFPRALAD